MPVELRRVFSAWVAIVALLAISNSASARAASPSPFGFAQTWNAAVRFIRVDQGFAVSEKDDKAGYILFQYVPPGATTKASEGSLEIVRSQEGEPVSIIVQLPKMPRAHEQVLLDGLLRKLRVDYGDTPVRAKAAPEKADASAD